MELYAVAMLEVCMKRDGRTLEEIRKMAVEGSVNNLSHFH